MRKAGIILCVLILLGGFAAAWVVLSQGTAPPGANELADSTAASTELQPLDSPGVALDEDVERDPAAPIEAAPEQGTDKPADERKTDTGRPGSESTAPIDTRRTTAQTPPDSVKPEAGKMPASQDADETSTPPPEPFIKGHSRPPGQNLGNTRPRSRRLSQPAGVKKLEDVTPNLRQDRRGLYAQYFQLYSADLTKLDKTDPDMVRIDRQVYFPDRDAFADLPISLDNFAAEWTGFLVIDEPGDYWLFWGADNGGRVELDGETVLLQDGMVRYVEVSTVLTLEAGLHPLKIEFAQTRNNVADWAKCAAALMYVPEGESKPVPVPPEMLMVPEWMWHEDPPIITGLSSSAGEIGDGITIRGQSLHERVPRTNVKEDFEMYVSFAGQRAPIVSQTDTEIKVRVPLGAKSGDVIVYLIQLWDGGSRPIPSNSIKFEVTTQFGLIAEWHNLEGWSNFGFESLSDRESDFTATYEMLYFGFQGWSAQQELNLPFQKEVIGARFRFRLGVPVNGEKEAHEYVLMSNSPLRVLVNGEWISDERDDGLYAFSFFLPCNEDNFVSVVVEWVSYATKDRMLLLCGELRSEAQDDDPATYDAIPPQYFFLPAEVPEPPRVESVGLYGEQPPGPGFAYEFDETGEPISVGGGFSLTWKSHADFDWDVDRADVLIDGIVVETEGDPVEADAPWVATREIGVIPEGVREGVAVVRITRGDGSVLESEPYYFNLATQGLATYLYDVPEGSGLNELPDLGPLHCFKVRKDKQINFESAADFDLPFPAETFVIEWLGGLVIEEEGDYEFICRSDDGMMLWLDDNVVIDANHRQAPAENKATVHLVPGTYRFRMQFFENNQHEVCVLEWRATRGEGEMLEELIPRQVIPARAFSLDVHPPFPAKTSTGKRTDGS